MGWIAATAVLVMIAFATGRLWASVVVATRKRPRSRGPFLAGVLCGVTAGLALTARRRALNTLGAATLKAVLRQPRAGTGLSLPGVAAHALTVAAAVVRQLPDPSRVLRQIRG
jgi:hypothetical protein